VPGGLTASDKVTGWRGTPSNIRNDGQLEGVILRARVAHARITGLDVAPARAVPASPRLSRCSPRTGWFRFVGAPIAAVAAKDRRSALEAIAAIKFNREKFSAVIGLDAARREDAPVVFARRTQARRQCVRGGRCSGAVEG
jgi:xanthine dehydrogenase YagR molybdenum-binding subunit